MHISVNKYDKERNVADVTYTYKSVKHRREVNAVVFDGKIDREATLKRIKEVALGVKEKIKRGVIT